MTGEPSAGSAALSVSFTYPPSAFLYAHTKPRLRVDGRDIPVEAWGSHQVAVEAGRHRIEVWVPYIFPRRVGRAVADVEVAADTVAELEYMAPATVFTAGALGGPGQQKSRGLSTVMTLNVVAVIAVLVILLVLLAI